MTVIYVGALLVLSGMLAMAYKAIWEGRLSGARRREAVVKSTTLEPQGKSAAFDPRANWLGLTLIGLGAMLLLAEATYF